MAKYFIVTKEKDFVSNSRNAIKHLQQSVGIGCMVYDAKGWLISETQRLGGKVVRKQTMSDGEPRPIIAALTKEFQIGTEWEDACKFARDYMKKIKNELTDGIDFTNEEHEQILNFLWDLIYEGKTFKEIREMCWEDSDAIFNEIF